MGAEKASYAYAWKTMGTLGSSSAGGSDCPVEPCNPLLGLHAARTRQDRSGYPPGGWHPQERLTGADALRRVTTGSAHPAHEEADRGTLSPGKLADFEVLPADPSETDPWKLLTMEVTATYVCGYRVSP